MCWPAAWATSIPTRACFNYFSPEDHQRAMDNLEQLGLTDKAHVRADSLSGGQQQRVGIARALMQEPQASSWPTSRWPRWTRCWRIPSSSTWSR